MIILMRDAGLTCTGDLNAEWWRSPALFRWPEQPGGAAETA
jgi:hypothetical protein